MNWWVKCISAAIVKMASRNVAFKASRMRDSIMEGQDEFIMRESDNVDVGSGSGWLLPMPRQICSTKNALSLLSKLLLTDIW